MQRKISVIHGINIYESDFVPKDRIIFVTKAEKGEILDAISVINTRTNNARIVRLRRDEMIYILLLILWSWMCFDLGRKWK
jgi:uncharacterized membrane protein